MVCLNKKSNKETVECFNKYTQHIQFILFNNKKTHLRNKCRTITFLIYRQQREDLTV